MEEAQREALASLRLTWAPTADDLWRPQAETHVKGLNEYAADDVMEAFGDAASDPVSTPLGVVVRGPAGSGKTHLLGQIRERVRILRRLLLRCRTARRRQLLAVRPQRHPGKPGPSGAERETQLKDLLWELSSIAHVSRADRRAIIGDDDLEPETLDRFVNALAERPDPVRQCHQTLRALVLLGATDLAAHDAGDAYLQSSDESGSDDRDRWRLRASPTSAQECVRELSRLIALAGPAVLALDQIDTLLAQSLASTGETATDPGDAVLEQVAHGLMAVRQTMRRTVAVVACLPTVWEHIRDRATASVADRFRVTAPLQPSRPPISAAPFSSGGSSPATAPTAFIPRIRAGPSCLPHSPTRPT